MTADTLRRAAALMRERAQICTPAPWATRPAGAYGPGHDVAGVDVLGSLRDPVAPRQVAHVTPWGGTQVARHIASWHPAVALAVANWLEEVAERQKPTDHWNRRSHGWTGSEFANAVALAYLGESS